MQETTQAEPRSTATEAKAPEPRWVPARGKALRLALWYAGAGALWILCSDWLLHHMFGAGKTEELLGSIKGWLFVFVSALLLWVVLNRYFRRIRRAAWLVHEARTRQVLATDNLPDSFVFQFTHDDAGRPQFAYISAGVERVHGVKPAEVLRDAACLFSQMDAQVAQAFAAAVAESARTMGDFDMDLSGRRPDGRAVLLHARSRPRRNNKGRVVWDGFAEDITERRGVEQALRESGALLRSITDNSEDVIFVKDRECRFVFMNPVGCRFVGKKLEKLLGHSKADFNRDKELASKMEADDRRVMESGRMETIEEEILTADGSRRVFLTTKVPRHDGMGNVIGLIGMARDITERKLAEEALAREKMLMRMMIDQIGQQVYVKDQESRFLLANEDVARSLGVSSSSELLGKTDKDFYSKAQADHFRAEEERVLAGEPLLNEEQSFRRPDGSERTVLTSKLPFRDRDGKVIGLIGLTRDITERMRTEAALRKSETQLREAQSIAGLGSYILEIPTGRWSSSDVLDKVLGIDEAYDRSVAGWAALIHPDDRTMMADYFRDEVLGRSQIFSKEYRIIRHNDQTERWVFGLGKLEFDAEGRPQKMHGTIQDITERKWDEKALRQTNARISHLNNVLLAIQDVSNLLSREKNPQELLTAVCQSLVKTRGYVTVWVGQPEAGSKRVLAVAHSGGDTAFIQHAPITWDDSPLGQGPTGTAIRERRVVVFDDVSRDPRFAPWRDAVVAGGAASIASIPILHGEQLFGALTIKADHANAFDVEELAILTGLAADMARTLQNFEKEAARRKAEAELRKLSRAVEQSPASIVITDTAGLIEYVNPKFTQVTGYTPDEAIGKNPRILKSGEMPSDAYKEMWQTIQSGRTWSGEFHNRKKNGELYWELASISPVTDETGRITHYLAVKEDITGRKILESQLRQAQKMEGIGQLAGGVAHDFNNILGVIMMQSELLRMQGELQSGQKECLGEIELAAGRASDLTRQLLLFSRKQVIQARDLDLNETVLGISKMLRRILGEDIEMQIACTPQPLFIHADSGMMEQVLMNLVVNSRDAMPDGGRLTIETSHEEITDDEAGRAPQVLPGPHACLTIMDTGAGIPPEVLPHIFEPFYTTKDVGKGTGLGLATVFGIVQQHGGWVEAQSTQSVGTTFRVFLPLLEGNAEVNTRCKSMTTARGGNETIMVVEDDADLRTLIRSVLNRLGYQMIEAPSGVEALRVWEENRDNIQLVLTDLVMPDGVSGIELSRRLRERSPDLKFIFMSGYSPELVAKKVTLRDGFDFLPKPFRAHELAAILRARLDA
jgi:PAS domain S-box-containing protein